MPLLIRWMLYLAETISLPMAFTYRLFLAYEARRTRRKPVKRELITAFPARRRKNFT